MSPKVRFISLLIAGIASIPLLYSLSFKKTMILNLKNKELLNQIKEFEMNKSLIRDLNKVNYVLENSLIPYYSDSIEIRNKVLSIISNYSQHQKLKLIGFPYLSPRFTNNTLILTNVISVEGSYQEILKLIYYLEYTLKVSKVASVNYYLSKTGIKNTKVLQSDIYFQNIQRIK